MRSLVLIVAFAAVSYYFTDAHSPHAARSVLFPLIFVLSLVALAIWAIGKMRSRSRSGGGYGRDSGYSFESGGDGGSGDAGDGGGGGGDGGS